MSSHSKGSMKKEEESLDEVRYMRKDQKAGNNGSDSENVHKKEKWLFSPLVRQGKCGSGKMLLFAVYGST